MNIRRTIILIDIYHLALASIKNPTSRTPDISNETSSMYFSPSAHLCSLDFSRWLTSSCRSSPRSQKETPSMQRLPTIKTGPFQTLHLKTCLQVSISKICPLSVTKSPCDLKSQYGFETTNSQHSYLKSGSKVPLSDCSTDGKEMIKLLNDYRQENGLPAIQKSCSLCTVANTKVGGTS